MLFLLVAMSQDLDMPISYYPQVLQFLVYADENQRDLKVVNVFFPVATGECNAMYTISLLNNSVETVTFGP